MRQRGKNMVWGALALVLTVMPWMTSSAFAADAPEMNILKDVNSIGGLLKLIVNILLYGLGAAATVGVVIAGILYLSARDNPQQVAKAKMRLIEIAIGLLAWAMLFAVLKFLIPGFSGIQDV